MSLPSLTIVIPMYNEEGNVRPLFNALEASMTSYNGTWFAILVNDGSHDKTGAFLNECVQTYGKNYQHIELQRNFGQTAAMQAGIDAAQTELIVTMDGDLQNDPNDIPRLVEELLLRDLDLLQGWRKNRQDDLITRKLPSRIANKIIQKVSGVKLDDYGCSLKVYRADVVKQVRIYGEMHRFIPVWVATVSPPHRIGQSVVNHRERTSGTSKYGISRTFRVIIDLLSVFFFLKFRARPGHFFGFIGLWVGLLGGILLTYLAGVKFILGEDIGHRPMLLIALFLIVASLQFLTTGVLSEILSRVFFQTTNVHSYAIRKPLSSSSSSSNIHTKKQFEKQTKQQGEKQQKKPFEE